MDQECHVPLEMGIIIHVQRLLIDFFWGGDTSYCINGNHTKTQYYVIPLPPGHLYHAICS